MNFNKLPADPTAIILGIASLIIVGLGCCCGLFAIGSLLLSLFGLVLANKSIRLYKQNPEHYTSQSRSNTGVGQIICIVGVVISSIFVVFSIGYFALFGSQITESFMKEFNLNKEKNEIQFEETDSLNDNIETDSIYIDTIGIEE
ncbi:MAG: hypothetical protein EOO46_01735 [Flavobacterium sp.]|nr:MAG: hypothetical protein EOO46_01735 [Flavobacterium sp.]